MKKIRICSLALMLMGNSFSQTIRSQKIMINEFIGIKGREAGLFACFLSVVNTLWWCDNKKITPVVSLGKESLYYQEGGYNGSDEPWEYYFYPVSKISVSDAKRHPGAQRWKGWGDPAGKGIQQTECWAKRYKQHLDKSYRREFHAIIKKYIRVKPVILDKVESFYLLQMKEKNTVGIHLRGTDKKLEAPPISIEEICNAANQYALDLPNCQFYIASDDENLLNRAKQLLNGPIIYYSSFRSSNGNPVHFMDGKTYSKAKLGEEALIDALLLARCTKFVHTRSNLSSSVLFLNPELDNKLLTDEKYCPLNPR
jgi:hypothetical protein